MAEKEYIEREAFVDHLENAKEILWRDTSLSSMYAAKLVDIFLACVKVFPAVDVAPVRHGRWNTGYFHDRVCSRCLHPDNDLNDYAHSYCPNCGAIMDGDTDANGNDNKTPKT